MMEGLKSDGIADAMRGTMDDGYPEHLWTEFVSDKSTGFMAYYGWIFFMLICMILLVIVTSIVIDAFGQLRDQIAGHTDQLTSECFICGLTKEDFHQIGTDAWDDHIHREHNVWDYLGYFLHIYNRCSDSDDDGEQTLSSQELFMLKQIVPPRYDPDTQAMPQSMFIKFFPVGRSISLERHMNTIDGDAESDLKEAVDGLRKVVKATTHNLQGHVQTKLMNLEQEIRNEIVERDPGAKRSKWGNLQAS